MKIIEYLTDYDWNSGTKYGFFLIALTFALGFQVPNLDFMELFLRSFFSFLLLLYPTFFTWLVLRRTTFEPTPKEYVLVLAWAGIIINLGMVLFDFISLF